jgi:hypothetical protein
MFYSHFSPALLREKHQATLRAEKRNEEQQWQGEINELCRRLTISFRMKSLCFCVAITDSSVAALRATA